LTDFESIVYEVAPPRATIRLNRPDVLNAFDLRMLRELAQACEEAAHDDDDDDDVRVVVLTETGRAFCVGADLRAWAEGGLVGNEREYWKWFRAMDASSNGRDVTGPWSPSSSTRLRRALRATATRRFPR
jgi:enoyl-CoA hydratase/carnithine racemase